eukprot:3181150-Rhodomonas_salina.1
MQRGVHLATQWETWGGSLCALSWILQLLVRHKAFTKGHATRGSSWSATHFSRGDGDVSGAIDSAVSKTVFNKETNYKKDRTGPQCHSPQLPRPLAQQTRPSAKTHPCNLPATPALGRGCTAARRAPLKFEASSAVSLGCRSKCQCAEVQCKRGESSTLGCGSCCKIASICTVAGCSTALAATHWGLYCERTVCRSVKRTSCFKSF